MASDGPAMDVAQLVAEHHQAVYRYAFRLTGSVADAEDLTQQAFLAAHQKGWQVRNADSIRSWMFAVLRNCFLKTSQKRRPVPVANLKLNIDTIPEETPDDEAIDRERLQMALDQLPPIYRLVLVMFYYEDRSYREIAEELDLPIGTVMSRLARAKAYLRANLFETATFPARDGVAKTPSQRG
jgi:RNA polymerase sigma-70 factor (ECF subfamily)